MFSSSAMQPFGITLTNASSGRSILDVPSDELAQMVEAHKAVVLRGFELLPEPEFIGFASKFGPLLKWEFGEVLNLRIEKKPQNHLFTAGRVELHWDGAYIKDVPHFSVFQCLQSSTDQPGGETLFTDTVKFVDEASAEDQHRWSGIQINYRTDKAAHYSGCVTVPLIGTHPYTGRRTIRYIESQNEDNLSVNPVYVKVQGLEEPAQEEFLRDFTGRLYSPDFMYRHAWQRGDFLMYDNHALLHGRARIQGNVSRHLQRIHILDRP